MEGPRGEQLNQVHGPLVVPRPYGPVGPSRRPLPTPRSRPESMPPAPRQSPLVVQAPAPSRPAILSPSATLAASPTALPIRRPLPTPSLRQHSSVDLVPIASPDRDLPSSFSRRTAPLPDRPDPRPTQVPSSAQIGFNVIERRSTVSGVPPPLERPDAHRSETSPSRRPLPSSPAEPPRIPSLEGELDGLDEEEEYEPMTFADPMSADVDDDEQKIVFARPPPSPKYGIRDLPTRSRMAIANRDDAKGQTPRSHPVRSATLPQPPTPTSDVDPPRAPSSFTAPAPKSTAEPQSLTLRFASMGLAEDRERGQSPRQVSSPQSPARDPVSPVRHWSGPLPRTPGIPSRPIFGTTDVPMQTRPFRPNGTSSPASLPTSPTHSARPFPPSPNPSAAFDRLPQPSPRPQPHTQPQLMSQLSERQLQKRRARDVDIDLDDAPPPSLRRSPSPIRQGLVRSPVIEITNDTPPRRQWTPGQDVTSRVGNRGGYVGFRTGSQSPERRAQPLPLTPVQSPAQPAVPMISLPDGQVAVDDDDGDIPSIVVSGPGISVSASGTPAISISDNGAPAMSVDSPSSPPKISVSDSVRPSGNFGSRHTQIQESSPLHSTVGRGPGSKRGLPSPPSSWNAVRTGGLSCGGCNGPIMGRIVSAMGQRWHPQCFKCSICHEHLEHVSSYERDGKPYCHLDYHETFAPRCFHCKTAIIDERFITLDDPALGQRTYHEQHFFCAECGDPFLAPNGPLPPGMARTGELNIAGDGEFVDDDVGFTVYKGHPYCEACHVRLRMPKCKTCKKSIRDGVRAVEALGSKYCWGCFVCEGCKRPFEDPSFFLRNDKPFCEPCFSLMLRNEV